MPMTSSIAAICARRKLTNRLIADHDAARLKPFLDVDCHLITGDGAVLMGREAVLNAFAKQFADPGFVTYVRTTGEVRIDTAGNRASETGEWVATWADSRASGVYLACWRKITGQWVIESELYITL